MSHLGKRLSALVDGELDGAQRDRVLAHLARCEPCRVEAATLRLLKLRMRAMGDACADDTLTRRLMALAAQHGDPAPAAWPVPGWPAPAWPGALRRRRGARAATAAAAALLAVGVPLTGFLLGGGQPSPGPKVTPAVDVFIVQHAITTGEAPARAGGPGAPASSPGAVPGHRPHR